MRRRSFLFFFFNLTRISFLNVYVPSDHSTIYLLLIRILIWTNFLQINYIILIIICVGISLLFGCYQFLFIIQFHCNSNLNENRKYI